jgi:hypothetical protein
MNLWFIDPEILNAISFKKDENGNFYIQSLVTDKARQANVEEIIRSLVVGLLIKKYKYPVSIIQEEFVVQMGSTKKRADIVILNKERNPEIIIEVKQEINEDSIDQLKSYMSATISRFGMVISLLDRLHFYRNESGTFLPLNDLPIYKATSHVFMNSETTEVKPVQLDRNQQLKINLGITSFARLSDKRVSLGFNDRKVSLSDSELFSYRKVRRIAIRKGISLPGGIKQKEWEELCFSLMQEVPLPRGKRETVVEFIKQKIQSPDVSDDLSMIDRKAAIATDGKIYLKISALKHQLQNEHYDLGELSHKKMAAILRQLGFKNKSKRYKNRFYRLWMLPLKSWQRDNRTAQ